MSPTALTWSYQEQTGTYTAPGGWLIQPIPLPRGGGPRWELLRHGRFEVQAETLTIAKAYAAGITGPVQAAELPPPQQVPFSQHLHVIEQLVIATSDGVASLSARRIIEHARRERWIR